MTEAAKEADARAPEWTRANREAHSLAKSLGMDHQALSDFAAAEFGVESMADLSVTRLRGLCARLRDRGAAHKKKRRPRLPNGQRRRFREDAPDALPTPEQDRFIQATIADVKALLATPFDHVKFIRRILKNESRFWPQTRREAGAVIEGLKNWKRTLQSKKSETQRA